MTRVATVENEDNLLLIALNATGAQLERICRRFRTAQAAVLGTEDAEAATHRYLLARPLGGGLVKLEAVVLADEADLLMRAVDRARDELRETNNGNATDQVEREGVIEISGGASAETPPAARQTAPSTPACSAMETTPGPAPVPTAADALVHVATSFLATKSARSKAALPESAGPRYQVVVHLERDLLRDDRSVAASLEDGTAVPAETFRRIACDAGLVAATFDAPNAGSTANGPLEETSDAADPARTIAGQVLDMGRKTRVIPTAIRRALWLRDRGCRFPGCSNGRFLHGHHVEHWLHGGRTALDNLVSLCSFHHRQVHEGGFTLRLAAAGDVEIGTPAGAVLPHSPRPPRLEATEDVVVWLNGAAGSGRDIDAWTATSSWDGENASYDDCVSALMVGGTASPEPVATV